MALASPGELVQNVPAASHEANGFPNRRSSSGTADGLGAILALVSVDPTDAVDLEDVLGGVLVPRRGPL